jgi:RNA 2',3'-cyclic 3'-phosphodiesterase
VSAPAARLFVAIDPPAELREALAAWARSAASALRSTATRDAAGGLRILDAESLHVTLCFLGSRPIAEIDVLANALACVAESDAPQLCVGAPVWLPPRRPRSLAVEVNDAGQTPGALAALQGTVVGAIAAAVDWRSERRRFRGHVTVARARPGLRAGRTPAATDARMPPTPRRSFAPADVVLYRSWLAPAGATYEAVARAPLRRADGCVT